ncbi:MAG TPA: glycoside hydrolase family 36 protein [Stackebrandtia sp.]|jgi:alpha-galactosidase|uniref:glycoside hydrolase family 36 protein n=1 Tax=Stackebrandtia sp. TaxID=2023065 RepID=UPI002D6D1AD0|nr:glycoside hydrolase family 36 protein [Stackebrandtia sp.]HZE37951.1 glycoside hydrolase family 36 protein [Stackebrandtia sp.]
MIFDEVARLSVDTGQARVYEHGWQSWSPTTTYALDTPSHRPLSDFSGVQHYRPGSAKPRGRYLGEGLLLVDDGRGKVTCFAAATPEEVPSIMAWAEGDRVLVASTGPVDTTTAPDMDTALADFGRRFAKVSGVRAIRPAPTVWCSWYHYFTAVTEADIDENLDAIGESELPVDVIQIDDGWQRHVGDWLHLSDRFTSLRRIVSRINASGRRAGIWIAPFLALPDSDLAREHPEWLLPGRAGHNWDADTRAVDPIAARPYLRQVFAMLREAGFDYFKLDFLYAGAMRSIADYRRGLGYIRDVVGTDSYILGCGAPILPSVGLCDAMRVSPDIAAHYAPPGGDACEPSQFGATLNTVSRAWQHGRFWVNDPDCIVARPAIERREDWASTVERYGGLRASSDRIKDLDEWGMDTTRRLLSTVPEPVPFS